MHAVCMQLCTYLCTHTGGKCLSTNMTTGDWKVYTCATVPKCCNGFEAKVDADACTHVHTHDCTHVHASVFKHARAYTHSIPYVYQHRVNIRPRFNALRRGWDKWRSRAKNVMPNVFWALIRRPMGSTPAYAFLCIGTALSWSIVKHA